MRFRITIARTLSSILTVGAAASFACVTVSFAQKSEVKSESAKKASECAPPRKPQTEDRLTQLDRLAESFVADLIASARFKDHKIKMLRTVITDPSGFEHPGTRNKEKVSVIVYDYTINKALYFTIVNPTREVISEERMSGRPQPSEKEIEDARSLIVADASLAGFLAGDSKIVGGFIVDGPPRSARDHRYMQMRIVSNDMRRTKKVVTVDLSKGVVLPN